MRLPLGQASMGGMTPTTYKAFITVFWIAIVLTVLFAVGSSLASCGGGDNQIGGF
jgi:hypothetical protein